MKRFILGLIIVSIVACSPRVTTSITKSYPPLDFTQKVAVIGISEDVPDSAIEIGTVKVDDSGLSINCKWDVVIEKAKLEAIKAGGNVIKITSHIPPSFYGSSCDRITATILKVENYDELNNLKDKKIPLVDSSWNYARLFVYRPDGMGFLVSYDLYLGDSVICRVKNYSAQELKITKKGINSLWAKTEAKEEIPIDIEFGREYYLRCSITTGLIIGQPQLQLVDRKQGNIEFNSISGR